MMLHSLFSTLSLSLSPFPPFPLYLYSFYSICIVYFYLVCNNTSLMLDLNFTVSLMSPSRGLDRIRMEICWKTAMEQRMWNGMSGRD